jgi:hypothetical protein
MKFDVLDNISFRDRTLLLILCGLSCCWGFVNNTILLVLAGKIGFPLAVSVCAITVNKKQIQSVAWYTVLLIAVGTGYFTLNPVTIDTVLTKNFIPTTTDLILALGLGAALSYFWSHAIRINLIVMSAGLASLLPACIISGYWISKAEIVPALNSIALYAQYVLGMCAGAGIVTYFERKHEYN